MRENDFLQWIQTHTPAHPDVPINIGDDMAAVTIGAANPAVALLKTDQCLDQVHFDLRKHSAAQAATKAVNRSLSDIAAMAGVPAAIMIAVALPKEGVGSTEEFARELFSAAQAAGVKFNCPLVGGDTAAWDQRLAITVSALGTVPAGRSAATRAGAKPGDTIFVSGALGGSILGRHLSFTPRIALAQKLAQTLGANLHAMMDLSDGLAQDLPRLCKASEAGAQIFTANLPIHEDAHTLAETDRIPPGLHALADGEDYELLFAIHPDAAPDLIPISQSLTPLTAVGIVTEQKTLRLIDAGGNEHPWPNVGWQHQQADTLAKVRSAVCPCTAEISQSRDR